jgi:cytochrome oxidase Cu insertion factor (SCO1/SenC/PrrC family)
MQRTWFKWLMVGVSFAILASFSLPVLLSLNSGDSGTPAYETPPPDILAPDFTLLSASGESVRLYDLLEQNQAVVIVFYRGFF